MIAIYSRISRNRVWLTMLLHGNYIIQDENSTMKLHARGRYDGREEDTLEERGAKCWLN